MGRLYLDPTPAFSNPADTGYKTFNADGAWGAPEKKALDAMAEWTVPEMGLKPGTPGDDVLVRFLTFFGEPITWRVIGHNLDRMPEGSITLLSDKILAMMPFDAREPSNKIQERTYRGNNDYTVANIRQWLNSDKGAGAWYSAQHSADKPPSASYIQEGFNAYTAWAGFLNSATTEEKALLLETTRQIGVYPGNGASCKDKVFLLTTNEIGRNNLDGNGTKIPYFTEEESHTAYLTETCISLNEWDELNLAASTKYPYMTATSNRTIPSGFLPSNINNPPSGARYADHGSTGLRPACNIPDSVKLKRDPDGILRIVV